MKKLVYFLRTALFLGFAYMIGGIKVHSLIVGEEVSQTYYHNWAIGVSVGTIIVLVIGLVFLVVRNPLKACKETILYFFPVLCITITGFMLSTDKFGGSFLKPQEMVWFPIVSLLTLSIIYFIGRAIYDESKSS